MLNKAETLCQKKKKSFRGTILPLLESLEVKVHTYVIYKQNHKMLHVTHMRVKLTVCVSSQDYGPKEWIDSRV